MKNNIFASLLIFLLLLNITLILKIKIERKRFEEIITKEYEKINLLSINYKNLENLLYINYKNIDSKIDTSLIYNSEGFVLSSDYQIALYYNTNLCNICEEDLFKYLSKVEEELKDKLIVFIPMERYKDFKTYNKQYLINFKNVYMFKKELLNFAKEIKRGIFFTIENNTYRINNIFIPPKPLKPELLDKYIKYVSEK